MQRKQNNSWIGIVIFLLIMFGSPITRFLANMIYQATGMQVDPNMLLVGLIILSVVLSSIVPLLRGLGGESRNNEVRLPTEPTSASPMKLPTNPPAMTPPPTPPQLSASPRFEPIVDPRILIVGLFGLVFFVVIFLFILSMTGVI
ncbi:hypothetical protein [Candidatus Oscillochloris fontis]|uniref:hypothetical protein n=1 Tax=Candidatus Oscillochloris fontis TaxID=2496868 RepID=UPI00101CB43A|nr:hypothetical protein [Candidatus Oscillochloris fontis]